MKVNCTYTKLVNIEELVRHPKNPNTHSEKQINLLAKILLKTGFRSPIVVSERSGFIVKGHGRLESAIRAGFNTVPIDVQTYENEAEEYADMIADNRIAELSEMDSVALKDLIEELDTGEFDLDMTGFSSEDLDLLMSQFHQEEDFSDKNKEIDVDGMDEKIELVFKLDLEDYTKINQKLLEINEDRNKALLEIVESAEKVEIINQDV